MDFHFHINNIHEYYRESTHDWIVAVYVESDNISFAINYPAKTLNKARKNMFRKFSDDVFKYEFEYRMQNHEFDKFLGR